MWLWRAVATGALILVVVRSLFVRLAGYDIDSLPRPPT
jgi:hypothetical protein